MKHHEASLEAWLRQNGVTPPFRALAELIPDAAVVVTGAEGRILYWSLGAERMLGFPADQMLGRPCPDGVLCDRGAARAWGSVVRVLRADGIGVQVRHFGHAFHEEGGGGGMIALLQLASPIATDAPPTPDLPGLVSFHGLLTRDPAMARVFQTVRNIAETEATVLLRGESGTGKELIAHAIHQESPRRDGPFIAVNCAAFTPTLLESELFGHVKGAFTGAVATRKGIFAQADGGTLFLDEVAELPLETQAHLLRVLQERVVLPVGASEGVAVDVRVVAATHRALREEVAAGRFRADLMFRLRVVPLFLPALRERKGDIDVLLQAAIAEFNRRGLRQVARIAPEAMRLLLDYAWPGNVRELRNVVEYAFAVGRGPEIGPDELPPEFREGRAPLLPETSRLRAALDEAHGDLHRAAELLGVSRTTLWRMRRKANLD